MCIYFLFEPCKVTIIYALPDRRAFLSAFSLYFGETMDYRRGFHFRFFKEDGRLDEIYERNVKQLHFFIAILQMVNG